MAQNNKTIAMSAEVLDKLPKGTLNELVGAMQEQIGSAKLDKEQREELKERLGVDDKVANAWNTAGDVLKMVDTAEMLANRPDLAKKSVDTVLGVVGAIFPVALIGKTLLAEVPEETYSKIIGVLSLGDPVHLARTVTGLAGAKTLQNAVELSQYAESLLEKPESYDTSLVIIAKDELLAQAMAQLIDRTDDTEDSVVGYGWAGNDAYITNDTRLLEKKPAYEAFLKEIEEIDFDRLDKSSARFKMDLVAAAKIAFATPILLKDLYDYQVKVTRQQLIYGIYKMYVDDLDKFINQ